MSSLLTLQRLKIWSKYKAKMTSDRFDVIEIVGAVWKPLALCWELDRFFQSPATLWRGVCSNWNLRLRLWQIVELTQSKTPVRKKDRRWSQNRYHFQIIDCSSITVHEDVGNGHKWVGGFLKDFLCHSKRFLYFFHGGFVRSCRCTFYHILDNLLDIRRWICSTLRHGLSMTSNLSDVILAMYLLHVFNRCNVNRLLIQQQPDDEFSQDSKYC